MRILSVSPTPRAAILGWQPARRGGSEAVSVPLIEGEVSSLPAGVAGMLLCSDLQSVAPSVAAGGALLPSGVALAEALPGWAEAGLIPDPERLGVILAGDLFGDDLARHRGADGPVDEVWAAFEDIAAWVVGVAGNHDRFAGRWPQGCLDGQVVERGGLRIGGVSWAAGRRPKRGERPLEAQLSRVEAALAEEPDLLVLHEGPPGGGRGERGLEALTEILCGRVELVVCGHEPWPRCLSQRDRPQVCNPHGLALLLR